MTSNCVLLVLQNMYEKHVCLTWFSKTCSAAAWQKPFPYRMNFHANKEELAWVVTIEGQLVVWPTQLPNRPRNRAMN